MLLDTKSIHDYEYVTFSKFSDVLTAFTCASATGNFCSISLGVNILIPFPCFGFNENIALLKAVRVYF